MTSQHIAAILDGFVPPLDIARETARRVLTETQALDTSFASSHELVGYVGGMEAALRMLLGALDKEDARVC